MPAEAVGFMSRGANGGRAAELVTRDFLSGCAGVDDARDAVAARQHDATPGKLSLPKHARPSTPRDLNLFPAAAPCPASGSAATTTYHSVCTIEKVKTALERFERGRHHHHHPSASGAASPSSSSVTTSSVKRQATGATPPPAAGWWPRPARSASSTCSSPGATRGARAARRTSPRRRPSARSRGSTSTSATWAPRQEVVTESSFALLITTTIPVNVADRFELGGLFFWVQ